MKNETVEKKELEKVTEIYAKLTPTNRTLSTSVAGLLLASQETAEFKEPECVAV